MTNKEAITWLSDIRNKFTGNCTIDTLVPISRCDVQAIDLAIKALEERPQGEWLWLCDSPDPKYKWSCNKCGRGVKEQENFCPNCGAEMKGEEHEV